MVSPTDARLSFGAAIAASAALGSEGAASTVVSQLVQPPARATPSHSLRYANPPSGPRCGPLRPQPLLHCKNARGNSVVYVVGRPRDPSLTKSVTTVLVHRGRQHQDGGAQVGRHGSKVADYRVGTLVAQLGALGSCDAQALDGKVVGEARYLIAPKYAGPSTRP